MSMRGDDSATTGPEVIIFHPCHEIKVLLIKRGNRENLKLIFFISQ